MLPRGMVLEVLAAAGVTAMRNLLRLPLSDRCPATEWQCSACHACVGALTAAEPQQVCSKHTAIETAGCGLLLTLGQSSSW
jgi:hypothetical protein